jgi:hypothetical protein
MEESRVLETFPTSEGWHMRKIRHICAALNRDPVDVDMLREEAKSNGGLLSTYIRKESWHKLLGINRYIIPQCPYLEHKDKHQISLDVNRCGRRLPKELTDEGRNHLQDQLTRVITRVLVTHPHLSYYQGFHDVVLTFLLVLEDEDLTFSIVDILVQYHIRDYLDADIERTRVIMNCIGVLLSIVDPEVASFIQQLVGINTSYSYMLSLLLLLPFPPSLSLPLPPSLSLYPIRSGCQYLFALSWIITWFSHVIDNNYDLHRLIDLFLASHPLMPVYIATALVISRRGELLSLDCDMSSVHPFLNKMPEDLNFEDIISRGLRIFDQVQPHKMASKGGIRLNQSLLVRTHSQFSKRLSGLRPDRILKDDPQAQPIETWVEFAKRHALNFVWYMFPILLGVAIHWWLSDGNILLSIND